MSRRSRRQSKLSQPSPWQLQRLIAAEVERRMSSLSLPPGAQPRAINQAPAKQGTPMFAPGAPLMPQPGMVLPDGPRQWQGVTHGLQRVSEFAKKYR